MSISSLTSAVRVVAPIGASFLPAEGCPKLLDYGKAESSQGRQDRSANEHKCFAAKAQHGILNELFVLQGLESPICFRRHSLKLLPELLELLVMSQVAVTIKGKVRAHPFVAHRHVQADQVDGLNRLIHLGLYGALALPQGGFQMDANLVGDLFQGDLG